MLYLNIIVLKRMSYFCTVWPGLETHFLLTTKEGTNKPYFVSISGEVIAVVGSCETLGGWCHQKAVILQPAEEDGYMCNAILCLHSSASTVTLDPHINLLCLVSPSTLWRTTVEVPRRGETKYRYFMGLILESKVRFSFPSKQTW